MTRRRSAVAVGGLDPSGGAGVLADVAAIRDAGAWGAAVCACSTVQHTRETLDVCPVKPSLLAEQLRALCDDLHVAAIKTGAMGSLANAEVVARCAEAKRGTLLVVDPVMAPSKGEPLLCGPEQTNLLPLIERADLLTPNVPEAEMLLARSIESESDMREAARSLRAMGPRAVLLKGGHLEVSSTWSLDVLATHKGTTVLRSRRLPRLAVHGTGCVLASLITGRLVCERARGSAKDIEAAVRWARRRFRRFLAAPISVGSGAKVLPLGVRK